MRWNCVHEAGVPVRELGSLWGMLRGVGSRAGSAGKGADSKK